MQILVLMHNDGNFFILSPLDNLYTEENFAVSRRSIIENKEDAQIGRKFEDEYSGRKFF